MGFNSAFKGLKYCPHTTAVWNITAISSVDWTQCDVWTFGTEEVKSLRLGTRHVSACDVKAGDILSSRHVCSCDVNACSWDVRGELTLNSMAHIHTSVTLLTSRDLAWNSGRLACQHDSQISAVVQISWDVTYVSSPLQTLPVVSRNGGDAYWKSVSTDLLIWHQVTRL
jgi:hypothetical protein